MTVVSIISSDHEQTVLAFATLVDYGSGKTEFKAAPWITVTGISPVHQSSKSLQLLGASYTLYIRDAGLTFVECVAKGFADPTTFLARDIWDENDNSVIS